MRVYTSLWMIHALAPFVPVVTPDGLRDPSVEARRALIRSDVRTQAPVFVEALDPAERLVGSETP